MSLVFAIIECIEMALSLVIRYLNVIVIQKKKSYLTLYTYNHLQYE